MDMTATQAALREHATIQVAQLPLFKHSRSPWLAISLDVLGVDTSLLLGVTPFDASAAIASGTASGNAA
jgi:hypothetical protein